MEVWWTNKVGFDLASTVIKIVKCQSYSLDSVIIFLTPQSMSCIRA